MIKEFAIAAARFAAKIANRVVGAGLGLLAQPTGALISMAIITAYFLALSPFLLLAYSRSWYLNRRAEGRSFFPAGLLTLPSPVGFIAAVFLPVFFLRVLPSYFRAIVREMIMGIVEGFVEGATGFLKKSIVAGFKGYLGLQINTLLTPKNAIRAINSLKDIWDLTKKAFELVSVRKINDKAVVVKTKPQQEGQSEEGAQDMSSYNKFARDGIMSVEEGAPTVMPANHKSATAVSHANVYPQLPPKDLQPAVGELSPRRLAGGF